MNNIMPHQIIWIVQNIADAFETIADASNIRVLAFVAVLITVVLIKLAATIIILWPVITEENSNK